MLAKAKLLLLLPLLTAAVSASAQEFGGNPPSIKWNQVNTKQAKVIFPAGMDSAGRRVADIISRMNGFIQPTIGPKQKQVSILLQNQNTISNAYVGLAPFRSEFYLTPDQNSFELGSLSWVDQLAIHEYRHVQQYNNFNVGLSRVFSTLFGQSGQAFGNELSIPNWFFEGDAVYNETLVSKQGRGRIPYFFNGYRALWAAGKDYSYMKLRNGSYKDYTPDHYPLGYMLVSYGREKYGNDFWKNVTHDAAAFYSPVYPFQHSLKKYAGVSFKDFRNDAFNSFNKQFKDKQEVTSNKNQHFIADQEYPAFVNDETIVYQKTTYKKRPAFILRTGTEEKVIRLRDISIDDYFSYNAGKIVYATYNADKRWGYQTYSDLRVLDVNTGKQNVLTHRTRYFSPDISADGEKIVTVDQSITGKSTLHILDASDGKLLTIVPNTNEVVYTYPKFYKENLLIAAIREKSGAMALALINSQTGVITKLVTGSIIGFPQVKDNTVYFTAATDRERLYAYEIENSKLFMLNTDAQNEGIGNYQPTVSGHQLAWTSFTAYGYRLHQIEKSELTRTEIPGNIIGQLSDFGITSLDNNPASDVLAKVNDDALPITKYSKAHGLFNFHSLLPSFDDPNYTFSLEGQNVLNTFQTSLLFNYNRDEGYKQFGAVGIYGGLYPYLIGAVNYTVDRKGYYSKTNSNIYWNEIEGRIGGKVPFNYINGTHVTSYSLETDVVYNRTTFQQAYRTLFADRAYTYLSNTATFSNRVGQARQNIYPKFAQTLTVNYKSTVAGSDAQQLLISGGLYFPGLMVNHSLIITGAYQEKNRNSVISFSNNFPFSRGYTAENLYRLQKIGVNYHFPIAYPDAGVANTVYLNRLRGNLFYDYTHANDFYVNGSDFKADFKTIGAELYFDTKWFNQTPITFGIRYSYLLDRDLFGGTGNDRIELIIPLTFF